MGVAPSGSARPPLVISITVLGVAARGRVRVVAGLAQGDAVLLGARREVLRREHEPLGRLAARLSVLLAHLAVLQRVIGQVGDKLVRGERDEARDALVRRLKAREAEEVVGCLLTTSGKAIVNGII